MITLKDFLKEQAEKQRAQGLDTRSIRQEWVQSLAELLRQMTEWLCQADQERILHITETTRFVEEEELGAYVAPMLIIRLGGRKIVVDPVARKVLGPRIKFGTTEGRPEGRVDLRNDEGKKYILYRFSVDRTDRWEIAESTNDRTEALTENTFEIAVVDLLK